MHRSCRGSLTLLIAAVAAYGSPSGAWVEPHAQFLQAQQAARPPSAETQIPREEQPHSISTDQAVSPSASIPKIESTLAEPTAIRPASGDNTTIRPGLVARYANAPVVRIDLLRPAREQALAQLSLADINRYQFRRNRSEEPGLPVTSPRPSRLTKRNLRR